MSMERIKQIIAEKPGILQCELREDEHQEFHYNGTQLMKLVRGGEIIRVPASRHNRNGTFKLYLPGQVRAGEL